ncbi:flagellar hook basal-body protein [Photobacterium leiognathi]|uniref:flagellar hook basal-body protein n=1 Tax=Photobacterium leiognathi TaxID=553611 RepID=UPI0029824351|nr:flagellar hook basal-body protein [Photobacterium leiognathi]
MDKIPEIVSSSISQNIQQVNRISSNTQNVNTVGFKALINTPQSTLSNSVNHQKVLDTSQGEIKQTGRNLDLAIHGDGWFFLRKNKEIMLSRNGQFQLDNKGFVVGSNGFRLQGTEGDIQVESSYVKIDRNGTISFEDRDLEQVLLVKAPKIDAGQYRAGNLYFKKLPRLDVVQNNRILQGYLEQSNVDPSSEVIDLMNAKRHIQTMQKSLAAYDQVIKKAISELGK